MLRSKQSTVFTKKRSYSKIIPKLVYRYETESSRTVRILLYSHYRITYLIKPDGNIDILGVFHGSLDIDRYLV
jgi:plasmid stabilization system protein ParE